MKVFDRSNIVAPDVAVRGLHELEQDAEKKVDPSTVNDYDNNSLEQVPSKDVQAGVQAVEAVTLTWSKNQLVLAYGL